MPNSNLLSVNGLCVRFGGILALDNVSFNVNKGTVTALIGPNGAGKTTVFNCLTGFYRPSAGNIILSYDAKSFQIEKLLGIPFTLNDAINPASLASKTYYKMFGGSHAVCRSGIARTFQNIRLFKEMTAIENLLVAQHMFVNRNIILGVFNSKKYRSSEKRALDNARKWLKFFDIGGDGNRLASELPYGHQRRLEMARAMCTNPKLICFDEPAAGLNPNETKDLAANITRLCRDEGVTVFVIEHDMNMVMTISEQIIVLDYGQVIAQGPPHTIKENPAVLAAYLGTEEEAKSP